MMNNTPSGAKKHRESSKPESHQTVKMSFFLSSSSSSYSSSDGLVQICMTLSRWFFHDGFSLSSAPAYRFFRV